MPYLDGRSSIVGITNPAGTLTTGYIQFSGQIVSQNPFYHWYEHGKNIIPHGDKWHEPTGPITANTQVAEKPQQTNGSPIFASFSEDWTFAVIADPKKIRDNRHSQTSLVSEQILDGLIPATDAIKTPSKQWILTHGTADVIVPKPIPDYGGTEVITSVYKSPPGKLNAFEQQANGDWKPIRAATHSQADLGLGGSTISAMKARGLLK